MEENASLQNDSESGQVAGSQAQQPQAPMQAPGLSEKGVEIRTFIYDVAEAD